MKQIAINDKIEETERLKEFIVMEEEQLAEKGKTFDEDKESFQNYVDSVKKEAESTANEVKWLIKVKNEKNELIREIEQTKKSLESETTKILDSLKVSYSHKQFLDEFAEFVGQKEEEEMMSGDKLQKIIDQLNKEVDSNTFITA